jgi:anti-sigma factor RsiW
MKRHLSDEQLVGYVHATLTDAGREEMDSLLAGCPECRARLADHEALQREIRYRLLADLRAASPPVGMRFEAIAPRLKRSNRLAQLWQRPSQAFHAATALAALTGLMVALIGLVESIGRPGVGPAVRSAGSLPAVACFLFAIPAASNYRESRVVPSRLLISAVVALTLWAGTAIVGLQVIVVVRDRSAWVLAPALSNWALIPLSIMWIALVVGGGEYHYKRFGQNSSWKLFGWTIAAEMTILILTYLM